MPRTRYSRVRMAVSTLWRPMSRKLESVSSNGKLRPGSIASIHRGLRRPREQSFLGTEVVEESGGGHPDPLASAATPVPRYSFDLEELDGRVDDLLPAQVTAGLTAVLVGTRVLAERGAATTKNP